jgi:hypothetical protein
LPVSAHANVPNSAALHAAPFPQAARNLRNGPSSKQAGAATEDREWEISGVIDWETAATGSALWDIGSLFCYARRYFPEFRELFVQGYRAGSGELPPDWCRTARLLDAVRLVAILNEERELLGVFAECRELIESVTAST